MEPTNHFINPEGPIVAYYWEIKKLMLVLMFRRGDT
jgi:hypothetical protein